MKVYVAISEDRVRAVFSSLELAQEFVDADEYWSDRVATFKIHSKLPARITWFVIERIGDRDVIRRQLRLWSIDDPHYMGYQRKAWNYSQWFNGERAFGVDEAAVERAWAEAH